MLIEVGKRYVTRSGLISDPVKYRAKDSSWPFKADIPGRGSEAYTASGRYWREDHRTHELDLVSEYSEPQPVAPSAPCLAEGDRIRYIGPGAQFDYTLNRVNGYLILRRREGNYTYKWSDNNACKDQTLTKETVRAILGDRPPDQFAVIQAGGRDYSAYPIQLDKFLAGDSEPEDPTHVNAETTNPTEIKLETGKRYVLRNGSLTPPLKQLGADLTYSFYAYVDGVARSWTPEGIHDRTLEPGTNPLDVVLEHPGEEPKPAKIKIEVGKRYVLVNGEITGPMEHYPPRQWSAMVGKTRRYWKPNGSRSCVASPYRIAHEYTGPIPENDFEVPQPAESEVQSQPKEQSEMSLKLTQQTLLNGEDAARLSDENLFARIKQAEDELERLGQIKNKPKSLTAKMEKMQGDIDALVQYIDSRKSDAA